MSDAVGILPLAVAAGGGTIDGIPAAGWVAAGVHLVQRSAPLVRALMGRRAAIMLPTSPAFFTALAACDGRGTVLVNPLAATPEIAHQLADADVGAVFTTTALASRLPAGTPHVLLDDAPRTARVVLGAGAPRDVDLVAHGGLRLDAEDDVPGRDEEAAIVYTSAMAGTPLGAILTHRNLIANARSTMAAAALTPHDHSLAVLPFSHLFGLVVGGLAPLLAGGRVTTMARFNPTRALDRLEQGDITFLTAVPAVFAAMVSVLERRGATRLDALRVVICGGAPLDHALQDRWAELTGTEMRQGYGLTEAGPVCLFNPLDRPNCRGSIGVPFPGVEVAIHDPDHRTPVADDTPGEICVRGDNVFRGYVSGGASGLAVRDGWLHTGDLGVRRADGTFLFSGVLKAMFTRNGYNIYPRELERVIAAMPGVRSVRVRGVPDAMREHQIAADVVGDVTEADVAAWCAERMATYKQPNAITIGGA
jgi:long-chain acyl-CoA synthetase